MLSITCPGWREGRGALVKGWREGGDGKWRDRGGWREGEAVVKRYEYQRNHHHGDRLCDTETVIKCLFRRTVVDSQIR